MKTWTPTGWVFGRWPYLFEADTGTWWWVASEPAQWTCGPLVGGPWLPAWEHAPWVSGWTYWQWPYAWSEAAQGWYFNQADRPAAVNLTTGEWHRLGPEAVAAPGVMRTHFLRGWRGGDCPLFFFSRATSDRQRAGMIEWLSARGYNSITPYLFCDKDGDGKHPVDVRKNGDIVSAWVPRIREAGLSLDPLGFADDSGSITGQSAARLCEMLADGVAAVGAGNIGRLCTFLEPDEIGDDGNVNIVNRYAVKTFPALAVGCHTMAMGGRYDAGRLWWWQPGMRFAYLQVADPNKPPTAAQMAATVTDALEHAAGRWEVHAFEYAIAERRDLGDAALAAGAHGAGCGCSPA